jgi:hypothetical protein
MPETIIMKLGMYTYIMPSKAIALVSSTQFVVKGKYAISSSQSSHLLWLPAPCTVHISHTISGGLLIRPTSYINCL